MKSKTPRSAKARRAAPGHAPKKAGKKAGNDGESLLREFGDLESLLHPDDGNAIGKLRHADALKLSHAKGGYPYKAPMSTREYESCKRALQAELLKVQNWVSVEKIRVVALFEGRDAAGKGGSIKRFMEHLNPRTAHVKALEKPTERERGQWYFQRYIEHLPSHGEMVFFDRSWYNRAGVERVMEFCCEAQYERFLRQCPLFESMLAESGVHLLKYWFSVSRLEQLRRFYARKGDPLKRWKLSPVDMESLVKWDEYTRAKESMFFHTDTKHSPWTVIRSDDKKRARINCMRHFLHSLDYPDKDKGVVGKPDAKIVTSAAPFYGEAAAAL